MLRYTILRTIASLARAEQTRSLEQSGIGCSTSTLLVGLDALHSIRRHVYGTAPSLHQEAHHGRSRGSTTIYVRHCFLKRTFRRQPVLTLLITFAFTVQSRLYGTMPAFSSYQLLAAASLLATQVLASPTPVEKEAITKVAVRATSTADAISNSNQLASAIGSFSADAASVAAAVSVGEAILTQIVPLPGPTAISQANSELQTILGANPGTIFDSGYKILLNGLAGGDYLNIADAYLFESNTDNINLQTPATTIYPKAGPNDAPYSLTESQLREVIYSKQSEVEPVLEVKANLYKYRHLSPTARFRLSSSSPALVPSAVRTSDRTMESCLRRTRPRTPST